MILRQTRGSSIPFGGVLILCTIDHTQQAPIRRKPFLVSSLIIRCFKMVKLVHSVRANQDLNFHRIQQIAGMHPSEYIRQPELLIEFELLSSNIFTFVDNLNSPEIDQITFRLYEKKKEQ